MTMKQSKVVWLAGVAILAAGASAYAVMPSVIDAMRGRNGGSESTIDARGVEGVLTPAGITLEPLAQGQGYGRVPRGFERSIAFASPSGMTLYTYEKDPPGKSTCLAECEQTWLAAKSPADAVASGDWSVITRDDGSQQWAYRSKPLYTYSKDVDPGSVYGNSPARFGPKRKNAAGEIVGRTGLFDEKKPDKDVPLPADWKVALAYPITDVQLPAGFAVHEIPDAHAFVLVDDKERTLYALADDAQKSGELDDSWIPVSAPWLATPLGDFSVIAAPSGVPQWAYRGKALYRYAQDLAKGFAEGVGIDKRMDVAAVNRYYMPPNVTVQKTLPMGKVLATIDGMTLYRRDGHLDLVGHDLRRGQPMRPAIGREIGINVLCDEECRKVWHPYAAPEGAQARGQWTVVTHPDGFRQWVYQGYALWTYDGDKQPGDMNGNDIYYYVFAGMPAQAGEAKIIDIGTPQPAPAAMYWGVMQP